MVLGSTKTDAKGSVKFYLKTVKRVRRTCIFNNDYRTSHTKLSFRYSVTLWRHKSRSKRRIHTVLNTSRTRTERLWHKSDVRVGIWKITGRETCTLKKTEFRSYWFSILSLKLFLYTNTGIAVRKYYQRTTTTTK